MKKLTLIIGIILFTMPLLGADRANNLVIERSSGSAIYTDVVLDTTDRDTLYILFPTASGGDWYMSETLPTKSATRNWGIPLNATGDLDFKIETTVTAGTTSPDSIGFWGKPLTYNPADEIYEILSKDSTFFVFDEAETYTSTSVNYITEDSSAVFHCLMSGLLWPDVGFVLIMDLADTDSVLLRNRCWFTIGR